MVRRYRGVVSINEKCDRTLPGASVVVGAKIGANALSPGATDIDSVFFFDASSRFTEGDLTPARQFIIGIVTTLVGDRIDMKVTGFKWHESTAGFSGRAGVTFRDHEIGWDKCVLDVAVLEQIKQTVKAGAILNVVREHIGIHTDTSF